MRYKVKAISKFEKELKRLAKKFPSLKAEYLQLIKSLQNHPTQGTPLGANCFKIRVAVSSKGKGKSGGARVITYVKIVETVVYLLTIFDKSEKENIPDKELGELLKEI
ncbi:MAG: type II toxin-antitoxin system RelE/ParE family toxin [Bacteroidota bacterium]|nr:type II toxin-antitoxin system RelE/ParE family toxin [Bacteroidota bacterium]